MSVVTGSNTVYPVSYTIPDDGDDIGAAELDVGFESLGDRTAYVKSRAQVFDSLTALRNSTDHVEGSLAHVEGYGTFYFESSTSGAELNLKRYKPNDILIGDPGRWVNVLYPGTTSYNNQGSWDIAALTNLNTTATLCDTQQFTAAGHDGGAYLRVNLQIDVEFESLYTLVPANIETRFDWYVEIEPAFGGTIQTSSTFSVPGGDSFKNSTPLLFRFGHGQFEAALTDANNTYDVRLYCLRVDSGGTVTYSRFKSWIATYTVTEIA